MAKETPKAAEAAQKAPQEVSADKKLKQALWAAMQSAIDGQIAGNRNHGWNNEDSFVVIESIVAEDAAQSDAEKGKYTLSEPASKLVRLLVNPSAYRQKEEKEGGRLDAKEGKRGGSLDAIEKEFS